MYINNEDFEIWMQKLSKKLSEIGQDLKSLINTKEVFDPYDRLFKDEVSYSKLCSFFDVQLKEDESFVYKKGIIELTQFGKDFLNSVR